MNEKRYSICVVGGSGAEGSGLALRWAHAGHQVTIGSRDTAKAWAGALELNEILGKDVVRSATNIIGAAAADIVVLTVPFTAQFPTVMQL